MKNTAAVALLLAASSADAIVFIPPTVYLVTLSFGAFAANTILFLAAWLAVKGVTDRSYLGKPLHSIVAAAFSTSAKATVFILSAATSVLLTHPVTVYEVLGAGAAAAAAGSAVLFLAGYREMRLADKETKAKKTKALAVFAAFIFIATSASTLLAQETKVIDTQATYAPEKKPAASEVGGYADYAKAPSLEAPPIQPKPAGVLWFYPVNESTCTVAYGGRTVVSKQPTGDCYFFEGSLQKRMPCPIEVDAAALGPGRLEGGGSCPQNYTV